MTTFAAALVRWERFNPVQAAGSAMLQEKEQIIAINQEQLYEEGADKDGNKLKPYSWREYADYKRDLRGGRSITDLSLTGEFQSKMNLRVEGDEYEISSSDEKTYKLTEKYGANIFGLSEIGKKETWYIIHDPFVQRLKSETGAG